MAKVTVGQSADDYLAIDETDISDAEALADDRGGFWVEAATFLRSLQDKTARELSFKQVNWALQLKEKLDDLRRRGKL